MVLSSLADSCVRESIYEKIPQQGMGKQVCQVWLLNSLLVEASITPTLRLNTLVSLDLQEEN